MADIALTAAKIGAVFPEKAEIYDMIAAVAITKGQVVYRNSSGKAALADANAGSGAEDAVGIALNKAGIGGAVSVLVRGHVEGFTVSGLTPDAQVYLSNTAGALADAPSATNPVAVGKCVVMPDSPTLTKVLYVDFGAGWSGQVQPIGTIFVSTEQTGNGASQNVAHGLGVVPRYVVIVPTDTAPATTGAYTAVEGVHTSTNVVVTVTSGKKYKVLAIA